MANGFSCFKTLISLRESDLDEILFACKNILVDNHDFYTKVYSLKMRGWKEEVSLIDKIQYRITKSRIVNLATI